MDTVRNLASTQVNARIEDRTNQFVNDIQTNYEDDAMESVEIENCGQTITQLTDNSVVMEAEEAPKEKDTTPDIVVDEEGLEWQVVKSKRRSKK